MKFLEEWALNNPLATNEAAREAVREKFGLSLGSEVISRTMRLAREAWESQRRAAAKTHTPLAPPEPISRPEAPAAGAAPQLHDLVRAMKAAGIRLIELLPDGGARVELVA